MSESVAPLGSAIETYARWETERAKTPLDRVVDAEVRSRKYLNSSERRWMSEAVYGAVRFLNRQSFLLQRLGLEDTRQIGAVIARRVPRRLRGQAPAIVGAVLMIALGLYYAVLA